MKRLLLLSFVFLILLPGCKDKPETATGTGGAVKAEQPRPTPLPTVHLLQQPLEPTVVELPTDALPTWRETSGNKSVLVLLSQDPLLAPLPAQLHDDTLQLVNTGSRKDFAARATPFTASPLLLPSMAVSAAIEAGYFSRVVWVLPAKVAVGEMSLETFRQQLRGLGAIDEAEAASFVQDTPGVFSGKVRGLPFQAVHPDALPTIAEPVVLHLDLSFFQPLYSGEIKTPLYPLLLQTLDRLRQKNWQAAAATLSFSNLSGQIPLASRFVGLELPLFFRDPTLFDKPLPTNLDLRARALYLENFFKKEEVRELYLKMEQAAPDDPSVKYALYGMARQFKEGDKALDYLRQAVKLDPVYAMEYLFLAELAKEQQLPEQVLRMVILARDAFPDNPFLQLHVAEQMLALGQRDHAVKLLQELEKLPWSPIYYPEIPEHLKKLLKP